MLRKSIYGLACLVLWGWGFNLRAQEPNPNAPWNGETDSYYAGIENYFKVTNPQITGYIGQKMPEEELPVLFFMAQRTGLDPDAVLNIRASGLSWTQVAWHFKLDPWIFFTPVNSSDVQHTPYEKVYGPYLGHGDKVGLSDADIVNLANLKFISEEYNCPPKEIIQMRSSNKSFREIHERYWERKDLPVWDVDVPGLKVEATPTHIPGTMRNGYHRNGMTGGDSAPSGD